MTQQESTALTVREPDAREMDLYRRHYAPQNTTDDEWEIFLETCRVYRVSPLRRQIYLVGRYDGVKKRMVNTPQVSIGTLRLLALRSREFEGTTEPEWGDGEGRWYKLWPERLGKHPYAARIGIYRKGFRAPVWGIAYFHEKAQTTGDGKGGKRLTRFWDEMGINQVIKCAEADGLRKAFEEECGGVYIHEEMNQADADTSVVTITPVVDEEDISTEEALRETARTNQQRAAHEQAQEQSRGLKVLLGNARTRAYKVGIKKQEDWIALCIDATGKEPDALTVDDVPKLNGVITQRESTQQPTEKAS